MQCLKWQKHIGANGNATARSEDCPCSDEMLGTGQAASSGRGGGFTQLWLEGERLRELQSTGVLPRWLP